MRKYKIFTILFLSTLLLVCTQTKNPVKTPVESPKVFDIPPRYTSFETSQSKCKTGSLNLEAEPIIPGVYGDSILTWQFHDNTLWITHNNAYYNCCAQYEVNILTTPNGFDLLEYESGPICWCKCYFDITTIIYNIQPGTYLIRVFSPGGYLVDSIWITIPPKFTGYQSFQGACRKELPKIKPEAIYPDYFEDSILVWSHADTAWILHKNANYNCAAILKVDVINTPDGFNLKERDESTRLATCTCYFDILTVIYGLSPGVYHIRVFNTYGNLVDEVELVMPPKLKATALIPQ